MSDDPTSPRADPVGEPCPTMLSVIAWTMAPARPVTGPAHAAGRRR